MQNVLRSFEQLQAVLSIENLAVNAIGTQQLRFEQGQLVASEPPELTARFDVEVLLPVSEEELAEQLAAQAAAAQQAAEGQPVDGQPTPAQ
ncbi:MAG: hypothetical protein HC838_05870 [Spirulinaceae cyanobacterium RM2_2_10]|nr:hypothetical protein [Spirulinaceae cyanobacterium RM2_2_10]